MTIVTIKQPYQTKFTIQTDCEMLVSLLRLKYGIYAREGEGGYVLSAIRQGASYTLRHGDETIETTQPLFEIDRILFERNRYDESVFALHGAAVEWRGAAYLFLASTTSGKTTLASYLSSTGFGYITDDCILLDRKNFRITPFLTPIHLREGGLQVLRHYGATPKGLVLLDDPAFPRYIYTPRNGVSESLPLARLFFIQRTEDENRVDPLDTNAGMAALMKAPITDYAPSGEYLRFIARLAKVGCHRLLYSDMAYVAEVIRHE